MMELASLLPGGADFWLDTSGDADWSAMAVLGVGSAVLARVPVMGNVCLYWLAVSGVVVGVLGKFDIGVPMAAVQALAGVVVALHAGMLSKRQSWALTLLAALLAAQRLAPAHAGNVTVALSLASVCLLAHRVLVTLVTLKASSPTPLIFPVVSHIMPRWAFNDHDFFRTDAPPEAVALQREAAFAALQAKWNIKFPKSMATSAYLSDKFSDLRFAAGNRVFIPFQKKLDSWCDPATVVARSDGTDLIDVDGNRLTDVSGSYGVNVAGYEAFKGFLKDGVAATADVGCVLGPIHPLVRENIDMLRDISGKEEVSFHMSGTEAVMAACRLVRFNSRKRYIVIFAGAYHGWFDGVQTLAGNERAPPDVLTLKDLDPASMLAIKLRASEIAAVVINPLQAFHPNAPPPSDLVLASNVRGASDSTTAYKKWLEDMRATCTAHGVALVFDEVYTGFRLAPGGAQEYFGVAADMVVYGKTLGGGIANGIVCGPRSLMGRGDPVKPLRVAYVIGTFAASPLLVGTMNSFLKWATSPAARIEYDRLRKDVQEWTKDLNARLEQEFPETSAPLGVAAYSSVWTMLYKRPGRYHWMLQYYLKDEGLNLSWVGTGRLSLSLDFKRADLDQVSEKVVRACHRMEDDGWWYVAPGAKGNPAAIKIKLVTEIVRALLKRVFSF